MITNYELEITRTMVPPEHLEKKRKTIYNPITMIRPGEPP